MSQLDEATWPTFYGDVNTPNTCVEPDEAQKWATWNDPTCWTRDNMNNIQGSRENVIIIWLIINQWFFKI